MNICPKRMMNPHPHNAINANDLTCLDYNSYGSNIKVNHADVGSNIKANHNSGGNDRKTVCDSDNNESGSNNKKEAINYPNLRSQLFNLNNLSINELRLKWIELYKSNPNNFQKGYLIKGLAYKIQSLYGLSNTSEDEIKTSLRTAKQKLSKTNDINNNISCCDVDNVSHCDELNYDVTNKDIDKNISESISKNKAKSNNKTKKQVFIPPVGSVISTYHKNTKYMVKVLEDNKFSYNDRIYKSLSAIANEITGTRWSGYAFFGLKK
jgi:hypothetical protein